MMVKIVANGTFEETCNGNIELYDWYINFRKNDAVSVDDEEVYEVYNNIRVNGCGEYEIDDNMVGILSFCQALKKVSEGCYKFYEKGFYEDYDVKQSWFKKKMMEKEGRKMKMVLANEVYTHEDIVDIMVSATDEIKDYEAYKVFAEYFKMLIDGKGEIEVDLPEYDYDALREYDIIDYDEDDDNVMIFNAWFVG